MNITPLKQGDPRWGDLKVGTGQATFAEVGCLVTAATMLANAYGDSLTPAKSNEKLIAWNGYSEGNLLIFAAVSDMSSFVKMSGFIECSNRPAPIDEINMRLSDGELALVELRPIANPNTNKRHWVLMYAQVINDYLIADPWDGTLKKLSAYGWGSWNSAMIIMRAVFYKSAGVKQIVTTAPGVRFRQTPGGLVFGNLPQGTPVSVLENGREWTKVAISGFVATEFIGADTPTPQPPPVVVVPPAKAQPRIGINVLNRHEEVALPLAQRGCRLFNVLDNVGFASRLKREYPDAIVTVRKYWNHNMPSLDEYLQAMDGCRDKNLIYLGLNENDEVGDDQMGIQKRFEWERGIISKLNELGATFAMGGFSMGSPNFLDTAICGVIRRLYAPLFNAGLASWNHHLYSPNMKYGQATRDFILNGAEITAPVGKNKTTATWMANKNVRGLNDPIAPIWFETRWRFLFSDCGFENNGKSFVYCDETGVDEGGVGGFAAHNADSKEVARWAAWWLNEQAEDVQNKPSPMKGGAMFQIGNREDWKGYNVENILGEIKF